MPVYNAQAYIRQAIESLLAQTYKKFRLLISDNASTDETEKICRDYLKKDRRVYYSRNKINIGSAENFNRVFKLSSGDYFMWACHDDYLKPNYLSSCLEGFQSSKKLVLVGSEAKVIDPGGVKPTIIEKGISTVGLKPRARFIRYRSMIHQINYMGVIFLGLYKRSVLKKIMPLQKVLGNDSIFLTKLCFKGEFLTVPKVLMVKRRGGVSKNMVHNARAQRVNNKFLTYHSFLVREMLLQKIIFKTDKLNFLEKLFLGYFSFSKYMLRAFKYKRFV